jgi:hypothetical protein
VRTVPGLAPVGSPFPVVPRRIPSADYPHSSRHSSAPDALGPEARPLITPNLGRVQLKQPAAPSSDRKRRVRPPRRPYRCDVSKAAKVVMKRFRAKDSLQYSPRRHHHPKRPPIVSRTAGGNHASDKGTWPRNSKGELGLSPRSSAALAPTEAPNNSNCDPPALGSR